MLRACRSPVSCCPRRWRTHRLPAFHRSMRCSQGLPGSFAMPFSGGSRFAIVSPTSSSAAIVAAAATSATAFFTGRVQTCRRRRRPSDGCVLHRGGPCSFRRSLELHFAARLEGLCVRRIGVTIVAKQIVTICGVHGIAGNPFQIAAQMVERLGEVKPLSVIIGVAALSVLVLLKRLRVFPERSSCC